ncbi:MAG: hypothetical protein JKY55_13835 [Aliivibrio sp.]|uniref:hypothetical protein n=1 Tax=Aliivibrio sp. TaxID=1872443 RepID=UPI001A4BF79C|nr:hypothetical protein [Aliivibrio sp.]
MRFFLLQYKRNTVASWSLLLVSIVLLVCFSQNLGLSTSCPSAIHSDEIKQTTSLTQGNKVSECSSSEHLLNAHTLNLDLAIPLFILALAIIATTLKQVGFGYYFTEPITSYGVRRHLAFCTFQE